MPARKIVTESEINFLENAEAEFVSLVQYGAIQDGFRILKHDNGEKSMTKMIYKVLAPVDVNEEKLKEITEHHELSLENKADDELDGFYTYKQGEDEHFDLEQKELVSLDRDNNIYGVVAALKVQAEKEGVEKASLDYETMDTLADGIFATMDILMGHLRVPEEETASRKDAMISALDNLKKHIEAVLKNVKAEDVVDMEKLEIADKYENLKDLFYQVDTSPDPELEKQEYSEEIKKQFDDAYKTLDETLDKFKEKVFGQVDEKAEAKAQEKIDAFLEQYEEMKKNLDIKLNEELDNYAQKEAMEKEIEDLKKELEELKNTTKKRQSEVEEETAKKTEQPKQEPVNKRGEFKFFTAV